MGLVRCYGFGVITLCVLEQISSYHSTTRLPILSPLSNPMSAAPDIFKIARNTRRRRVIELPGVIRKAVIQYGLEPQTVQPVTLVGTSGRYDHVCSWRCANMMVGGGQVKRVGTRHLRVAGRTAGRSVINTSAVFAACSYRWSHRQGVPRR